MCGEREGEMDEDDEMSGLDRVISETEATLELLNKLHAKVASKDKMDDDFRRDMGKLISKFRILRDNVDCEESVPRHVINSISQSREPISMKQHAINASIQELQSMMEKRNSET